MKCVTNQRECVMTAYLELLKWYKDIGCDLCYDDIPQARIAMHDQIYNRSSALLSVSNKNSRDIVINQSADGVAKEEGREEIEEKVIKIHYQSENLIQRSPTVVNVQQLFAPQLDARKTNIPTYNTFENLQQAIRDFDGCALKKTAVNTVIYEGVMDAKVMLVGEAPGAIEDKEGRPFCGQSGKLLDNIIASIGLDRSKNTFITNTVFWRPPGNRRPTAEEIDLCRPFLEQMIKFVSPQLIILVGSTAVESLLKLTSPMNALRQQSFSYTNQYIDHHHIPMEVIFHPSYLLRQPLQKREMWHDMLKIQKKYLVAYS